jgi:ATP-dependent Clp protease ATP-binding subunit ClpA
MFERFTHAARDAVVRAKAEAQELHQAPVGTEHLLLALLADGTGPTATAPALTSKGVDAQYVRSEIVRRVGNGSASLDPAADRDAADREALKAIENFGPGAFHLAPPTPKRKGLLRRRFQGNSSFSPRNKKVLELSLREALRLKHNYIAPEHILLGLIREGNGLAVQILTDRGVDLDQLRTETTHSLNAEAA